MDKFYDLNKALSYDTDITIVVGAKGCGKIYGLIKQYISDYMAQYCIKRVWNRKWRSIIIGIKH